MVIIELTQTLTPSKEEIIENEGVGKDINQEELKEWMRKTKDWNQKMNELTMKSYLLIEQDILYGILLYKSTRLLDTNCIYGGRL